MRQEYLRTHRAEGPVVAIALHAGHAIRDNLREHFLITEADRLREEDPGTDFLTQLGYTSIIALHSRFEFDLNRPRTKTVYKTASDAWGLDVWNGELPETVLRESLELYDGCYEEIGAILGAIEMQYGRFLVVDLHSYNHRRDGIGMPPSDRSANPDIDINSTEGMRVRWHSVYDRLIRELREYRVGGKQLDVRENIRFQGPGHFARWVEEKYPESACVISVETKKFYMDEWTGEIDFGTLLEERNVFASIIPGLVGLLQGQ